jgi:hypothetical protein
MASNAVKKQKKNKIGRKMVEKWPEKRPKKSLDEAPVYIVYTAHFSRKMVEKW